MAVAVTITTAAAVAADQAIQIDREARTWEGPRLFYGQRGQACAWGAAMEEKEMPVG